MGDNMTVTYLDEIRLRGEPPVRARITMILAALISGTAAKVVSGQRANTLDARVVAGALIGLAQCRLLPEGVAVTHLRLALACLLVKQTGAMAQPITDDLLKRWVQANHFWPTVETELKAQQQAMRQAVLAGQDSVH